MSRRPLIQRQPQQQKRRLTDKRLGEERRCAGVVLHWWGCDCSQIPVGDCLTVENCLNFENRVLLDPEGRGIDDCRICDSWEDEAPAEPRRDELRPSTAQRRLREKTPAGSFPVVSNELPRRGSAGASPSPEN